MVLWPIRARVLFELFYNCVPIYSDYETFLGDYLHVQSARNVILFLTFITRIKKRSSYLDIN